MRANMQIHDISDRLYWSTSADDFDRELLYVDGKIPAWLAEKITTDASKSWFTPSTAEIEVSND